MATGKHYRGSSTAPRTANKNTRSQAKEAPAAPAPDAYEDLYSYEEPRGARRGTRRPTYSTPAWTPAKKKPSKAPMVAAILCLLAAAGILFYMLWDLGIIGMLLSILK